MLIAEIKNLLKSTFKHESWYAGMSHTTTMTNHSEVVSDIHCIGVNESYFGMRFAISDQEDRQSMSDKTHALINAMDLPIQSIQLKHSSMLIICRRLTPLP